MLATGLELLADAPAHLVFLAQQFAARRLGGLAGVSVVERLVGKLAEDPFLEQRALARKLALERTLALQQLYSLTSAMHFGAQDARAAAEAAKTMRTTVASRLATAAGPAKTALEAFDKKLGSASDALVAAATALQAQVNTLGGADAPPTALQTAGMTAARTAGTAALAKWRAVSAVDLAALNAALKAAGQASIK